MTRSASNERAGVCRETSLRGSAVVHAIDRRTITAIWLDLKFDVNATTTGDYRADLRTGVFAPNSPYSKDITLGPAAKKGFDFTEAEATGRHKKPCGS